MVDCLGVGDVCQAGDGPAPVVEAEGGQEGVDVEDHDEDVADFLQLLVHFDFELLARDARLGELALDFDYSLFGVLSLHPYILFKFKSIYFANGVMNYVLCLFLVANR